MFTCITLWLLAIKAIMVHSPLFVPHATDIYLLNLPNITLKKVEDAYTLLINDSPLIKKDFGYVGSEWAILKEFS